MTDWGFIYVSEGINPAEPHLTRVDTGRSVTHLAGVAEYGQAVAMARQLVAEGAELIELCGGFPTAEVAKGIEAVGERVPVGVVGYGPESHRQLYHLFHAGT